MLTQVRADQLHAMPKVLSGTAPARFPQPGQFCQLDVVSVDGREAFVIDVNRKGTLKLTKCTYQERYAVIEILVRLDIDGPVHENPDGVEVPTPHVHMFREGFGDRWAAPISTADFSDTTDLQKTFTEFLGFCHVQAPANMQRGLF
jgi:hypothetical protein